MTEQITHTNERAWALDPWALATMAVLVFALFWHLLNAHKHDLEVIAYQQQIQAMRHAMNDEDTIIKLAKLCTEAGRPWNSWPVDYGPRPIKCHLKEAPIIVANKKQKRRLEAAMGGRR